MRKQTKRPLSLRRTTIRTLSSRALHRLRTGYYGPTLQQILDENDTQSSTPEPSHNGIGDCGQVHLK